MHGKCVTTLFTMKTIGGLRSTSDHTNSTPPEKKMFAEYNPNPSGRNVGDCAVRAIAKALDIDWEKAYAKLVTNGYAMSDMPSADSVWGSVLRQNGFYRESIPNTCPDCYTAYDFCIDHPDGVFVLSFGGHVATVKDGTLYDSWNSEREVPVYYWYRKEDK